MPVFQQGDIIGIELDPTLGHEQQGRRPVLVVSNDVFNQKTNLVLICPITSTKNYFPLHVPLDERTKTTGVVKCEQVRALDAGVRKAVRFESVPPDILKRVIEILFAEIEPT